MLLVPPSPELLEQIKKECNENPGATQADLESIKNWLLKQPHLPDTWDEDLLLHFLRGCNFSLETCKRKLDAYFTVRTAFPEFFTNRDITRSELQKIIKIADGAVLPLLTPDGHRVLIGKVADPDFDTPNMADLFKIVLMAGDVRLKMEETATLGDIYVLDSGFPLAKHALKINLITVKNFFTCVQESRPITIKQVHIVNAPPFVAYFLDLVRPFLSESLQGTIRFHTKMETLYEFVPRDILPEEFGGSAGKLVVMKNQWVQKLEEFGYWFEKENEVKSDELRRPGKAQMGDGFYGFEGSFKQLNID